MLMCTYTTRHASKQKLKELEKKLLNLHHDLAKEVETPTMVSCPNILLEFNSFHIEQVLGNCKQLFTVQDILNNVEIWRHNYAIIVLEIIREIFGDMTEELLSNKDDLRLDDSILSDWEHIRDDSKLNSLFDPQDLEGVIFFGASADSMDDTTDSHTIQS